MGNTGKLWGTALGFLIGGPVGGALGLGLGHLFDEDAENEEVQYSEEERLSILTPLINLIVKLCKVDGRINGEEILCVDEFFRSELEFSGDILSKARKLFNKLKKDKTPYHDIANECITISSDNEFKYFIIAVLITVAISDGFMNKKEITMINNIALTIGITEDKYTNLLYEVLNNDFDYLRFNLLAKFLKVDGYICKEEFDIIDYFLVKTLNVSGKRLKEAREMFNFLKEDKTSYIDIAERLSGVLDEKSRKTSYITALFEIAIVDGAVNDKEADMIENIAHVFGLSDTEYSQIKDTYCIDLRKCYTILECKETDSLYTIKQKYRQLIRQYHPDKIISKDMAKDIVDFAQSRFRDIQEAYDTILKKRQEQ